MAQIRCKYCEIKLDGMAHWQREDTKEINCELCEIICRFTHDLFNLKGAEVMMRIVDDIKFCKSQKQKLK